MKIAWLTDAQAPYREPLWREISALAGFEVSFVFRDEEVRHWTWHEVSSYRSSVVPAWRVPLPGPVARRLDSPMALLRPGVAADVLRGADALVIQNWWQPANLWCALLGRRRGIPYLMYAESTLVSRRFRSGPLSWLRSFVFRHAGAVVVPGPAAAAAAVADGTPAHRVVESVNSVDLDLFVERVRELRAATGPEQAISGRGHRYVYVGQLIERKNVVSLVRAFAGLAPSATLEIAGDGVELEGLRALARSLGVEDRIDFHGFLDEAQVVSLLARSHTLVLPSTEEVYGFTALEAFVAGLQVVVSTRAGIAPNLQGKPGTWLVEPTDVDLRRAMAEAAECWTTWNLDVDADFASPQRAAADIVRAVEVAREGRVADPAR